MRLSGWGRYPIAESALEAPQSVDDVVSLVRSGKTLIARGNGRAYGDPAIGSSTTLSMLSLSKVISFDEAQGLLVCEAGLMLRDVLEAFVPRGWFPPVTPGTKFVTLGGMIACDVHGKNHHKDGSFGNHVLWLDLVTSNGAVVRCSRAENADLFAHTIGGMGLTGVIVRCCVRLLPIETAYIRQHQIIAENLDQALAAFESALDWTYSVAWIDCLAGGSKLGRSVVYLGEHAKVHELPPRLRSAPLSVPAKLPLAVPFELPFSALNRYTVQAFNELYFRRAKARSSDLVLSYDPYFYPLDSIRSWNRLYGYRGFVQYQCVLPLKTSREGLTELLELTSKTRTGSFLGVLKLFGSQDGVLSFPLHGYTLTLDFPWSDKTAKLLRRFDDIVARHGGRLYLAKDARLPRDIFERTQPNLERFRGLRASSGAGRVFNSLQSQRLGL
jgi:FAD/FMN-containing dehydrogenase